MEIKVEKVRSEEEVERFREFWDEQKEHEEDPEEAKNNFFSTPSFVVYFEVEGKLIGMAFIYVRDIIFEKKKVKLGGIGGVVTHRAHRKKGIATKILNKILEVMRNENVDISLLCTNLKKHGSLYQRVGFAPLERPYFFEDRNGKIVKDNDGMIAPVNSPEIVEKIINSSVKFFIGKSNF